MPLLQKVMDSRGTFRVWTHLSIIWMKAYQVNFLFTNIVQPVVEE